MQSIVVDRSISKVFKYLATDFALNYYKWEPSLVKLEQQTPGPIQVGAKFSAVHLPLVIPVSQHKERPLSFEEERNYLDLSGRIQFENLIEVIAFEPEKQFGFRSTTQSQVNKSYSFSQSEGNCYFVGDQYRTRIFYEAKFLKLPLTARVAQKLFSKILKIDMETNQKNFGHNLKNLLEAEISPS